MLWGACQPPTAGGARPYAPWRQILSAAAPVIVHEKDISAELLNWLLPLVPDLSILRPGLLAPSEPNPGELRAALRQVFHILVLRHPLILVIEDAHWADEASLDLLRAFGETCASLPLLLLVTHHSGGETPQLLEIKQSLRRERSSSEIALHPFTPGEIRAFLEAALEMENVSEPLVRDLAAYSGGLPLLLREAADSLVEARRLHYAGNLPPGLREALRLRLDRLEAEPRRMIEAAAILGLSFLERVLQAVLGWESPSYAAALDTLLARRLLVNAQSTGQDDYAFSHRSIQEVILGEITEGRAAELHAAAARALEELYGESMGHADEIARHYEAAGQPIQAASHWLRHAEDVTDVSAYELALEIIAHAVELASGSAETRQLPAQAALQRAAIAHNQGQLDQVPALLESALSLCIDYPRLYCKALFFQAHVFFTGDHWQAGRQSASQAIALARASGDSLIEGRALHIRALCDMMLGRTAAAAEDLESALSRLEGAGQSKSILYARNLNHLGTALTFMQEMVAAGCANLIAENFADQNDFAAGKNLFYMGSTSGIPFVASAIQEGGVELDWGITFIPYGETPAVDIYGASVSLIAGSSTPEAQLATWLFVRWFTEGEQQAVWAAASNYFPVRISTAENLGDVFTASPQYEEAFNLLIEGQGFVEPATAGYDVVRDNVQAAFQSILVEGADVQATLEALDIAANEIEASFQ